MARPWLTSCRRWTSFSLRYCGLLHLDIAALTRQPYKRCAPELALEGRFWETRTKVVLTNTTDNVSHNDIPWPVESREWHDDFRLVASCRRGRPSSKDPMSQSFFPVVRNNNLSMHRLRHWLLWRSAVRGKPLHVSRRAQGGPQQK